MEERPTRKFFLDLVCFLIIQVPYVYFFIDGKAYSTGFFCDDENLKYPFKEDRISLGLMALICIASAYIVIIVTNIILYVGRSRRTEFLREYQLCCCRIHPCLWVSFKDIATFMVGASLVQDSCEATKIFVGRLRPHFFDVCRPNLTDIACDGFVSNFTCADDVGDDRLYNLTTSFPSSHASFSGFAMLYILFFLQGKMTWRGSSFLRVTLQGGALAFSLYCSATRISDHVHHASDVIAGLAFGAVLAVWIVFWVSDIFEGPVGADLSRFTSYPSSTANFQKQYNYGSTYSAGTTETTLR